MADIFLASPIDISFAITIDDTSPTVVYTPFADTFAAPNLTAGWNPFFSTSGFATDPTLGQEGEGVSFHVTSSDGASLGLRWNGTTVNLYGFFPTTLPAFPSSISYSVALDGVATTNYASALSTDPNSPDNILAAFTNLTNDEHIVELTVHSASAMPDDSILLRFDRAVITSILPPSTTQQQITQTITTSTFPDDLISYRGQWSFDQQLLPDQHLTFHTSTNVGDCASFQFNGTAITLSGLTTPHSGLYNISLDDGPPVTFSAHSSFNSSTPTLLFYSTGLDPAVAHRLDVVNAGTSSDQSGSLLIFGSVNVTAAVAQSGGTTPIASMASPRLPRGTIAAIAAVVGIVVIAAVAFLVIFLRRRRREAQRKEDFIVNPGVRHRRFSFLTRPAQADTEKRQQGSIHRHRSTDDADILDITVHKGDGDDDDLTDEHHQLHPPGGGKAQGGHRRQGSLNSDGSYSISLPELPGQGHVRPGSEGQSPSPTRRYTALADAAITKPSMGSLSPLSQHQSPPKPKGPREMRSISLHAKDNSRSILLKEMYTPAADVPTDVQTADAHSPISGIDYLPRPHVSPLRVNFEDEIRGQGERRREARHRSENSGLSLPLSLKQALWSHIRSPADMEPPEVILTDADGSQAPAYSFLDMDSSASRSASTNSRNTRQSRSASTRSSSKSRVNQAGENSARPSVDIPPLPQDPHVSMGLSMTMAGGPTSSRPSVSPDISLHAVTLSPLSIPDQPLPHRADVPSPVQPSASGPSEYQPSPTDSIPFTVSDIHFRHSMQSTTSHIPDSRRTSHRVSGSHRVPHPPLPASPTAPQSQPSEDKPFIVQKLLGLQPGSGPTTPYGSPTVSGFGASGSRWSRGRGSVAGPSSRSKS